MSTPKRKATKKNAKHVAAKSPVKKAIAPAPSVTTAEVHRIVNLALENSFGKINTLTPKNGAKEQSQPGKPKVGEFTGRLIDAAVKSNAILLAVGKTETWAYKLGFRVDSSEMNKKEEQDRDSLTPSPGEVLDHIMGQLNRSHDRLVAVLDFLENAL